MNNYDGIVSLLFFCIELLLFINIWFLSKSKYKNLIALILALLASYQLFEFLICGLNLYDESMLYFAFVIITYLPPTGLLLVIRVNNIRLNKPAILFIPAAFFTLYYFFFQNQFSLKKCTVLYASYHYPLGFLYGLFYYLPMLIAVILLIKNYATSSSQKQRKENLILLTGYLSFTIPMGIALILYPEFRTAIESVLCKFAIVFAIIISYFALSIKK